MRADGGVPLAGVLVGLAGMTRPAPAALEANTDANGRYTIAGVPPGPYLGVAADAPAGYADVTATR